MPKSVSRCSRAASTLSFAAIAAALGASLSLSTGLLTSTASGKHHRFKQLALAVINYEGSQPAPGFLGILQADEPFLDLSARALSRGADFGVVRFELPDGAAGDYRVRLYSDQYGEEVTLTDMNGEELPARFFRLSPDFFLTPSDEANPDPETTLVGHDAETGITVQLRFYFKP